MKSAIPFLLVLGFTGFICRSGNTTKQPPVTPATTDTAAQAPDSTIKPPSRPMPGGPTAFKPNVSRAIGKVLAVDLIDSLNFRIKVRLDSVFTLGDMESVAESGQEVSLLPRFNLENNGTITPGNERNHRLLRLRHLKSGSPFSGKISLQPQGSWVVLEADSL